MSFELIAAIATSLIVVLFGAALFYFVITEHIEIKKETK